jgi:hypothetical protein
MAGTDVRLDTGGNQDWITVQAAKVEVKASDLMLDSSARRAGGDQRGYRRALVHDSGDGLTINWDNDYPGGVTLHGVTHLHPRQTADDELQLERGVEPLVVVHGGIVYQTRKMRWGRQPEVAEHNLGMEITELQRQVAELTQRVAALEGR